MENNCSKAGRINILLPQDCFSELEVTCFPAGHILIGSSVLAPQRTGLGGLRVPQEGDEGVGHSVWAAPQPLLGVRRSKCSIRTLDLKHLKIFWQVIFMLAGKHMGWSKQGSLLFAVLAMRLGLTCRKPGTLVSQSVSCTFTVQQSPS